MKLLFALCLVCLACADTTVYVDNKLGSDAFNGTVEHPFATIGRAIEADADVIVVEPNQGRLSPYYHSDDRNLLWDVQNRTRALQSAVSGKRFYVELQYEGRFMDMTNTIIDPTRTVHINITDMGCLNGLLQLADHHGGCLLIRNVTVNLHNVRIENCRTSQGMGGGVAVISDRTDVYYSPADEAENTTLTKFRLNVFGGQFVDNVADLGGAIFYCGSPQKWRNMGFRAYNAHFLSNAATYGGAVMATERASSRIENCVFDSNRALDSGGAFEGEGFTHNEFHNCIFKENEAREGSGGALNARGDEASLWSFGCKFCSNHAGYQGGAIYVRDTLNSFLYRPINIFACNSATAVPQTSEYCIGLSCDDMLYPRLWYAIADPLTDGCTACDGASPDPGYSKRMNSTGCSAQVGGSGAVDSPTCGFYPALPPCATLEYAINVLGCDEIYFPPANYLSGVGNYDVVIAFPVIFRCTAGATGCLGIVNMTTIDAEGQGIILKFVSSASYYTYFASAVDLHLTNGNYLLSNISDAKAGALQITGTPSSLATVGGFAIYMCTHNYGYQGGCAHMYYAYTTIYNYFSLDNFAYDAGGIFYVKDSILISGANTDYSVRCGSGGVGALYYNEESINATYFSGLAAFNGRAQHYSPYLTGENTNTTYSELGYSIYITAVVPYPIYPYERIYKPWTIIGGVSGQVGTTDTMSLGLYYNVYGTVDPTDRDILLHQVFNGLCYGDTENVGCGVNGLISSQPIINQGLSDYWDDRGAASLGNIREPSTLNSTSILSECYDQYGNVCPEPVLPGTHIVTWVRIRDWHYYDEGGDGIQSIHMGTVNAAAFPHGNLAPFPDGYQCATSVLLLVDGQLENSTEFVDAYQKSVAPYWPNWPVTTRYSTFFDDGRVSTTSGYLPWDMMWNYEGRPTGHSTHLPDGDEEYYVHRIAHEHMADTLRFTNSTSSAPWGTVLLEARSQHVDNTLTQVGVPTTVFMVIGAGDSDAAATTAAAAASWASNGITKFIGLLIPGSNTAANITAQMTNLFGTQNVGWFQVSNSSSEGIQEVLNQLLLNDTLMCSYDISLGNCTSFRTDENECEDYFLCTDRGFDCNTMQCSDRVLHKHYRCSQQYFDHPGYEIMSACPTFCAPEYLTLYLQLGIVWGDTLSAHSNHGGCLPFMYNKGGNRVIHHFGYPYDEFNTGPIYYTDGGVFYYDDYYDIQDLGLNQTDFTEFPGTDETGICSDCNYATGLDCIDCTIYQPAPNETIVNGNRILSIGPTGIFNYTINMTLTGTEVPTDSACGDGTGNCIVLFCDPTEYNETNPAPYDGNITSSRSGCYFNYLADGALCQTPQGEFDDDEGGAGAIYNYNPYTMDDDDGGSIGTCVSILCASHSCSQYVFNDTFCTEKYQYSDCYDMTVRCVANTSEMLHPEQIGPYGIYRLQEDYCILSYETQAQSCYPGNDPKIKVGRPQYGFQECMYGYCNFGLCQPYFNQTYCDQLPCYGGVCDPMSNISDPVTGCTVVHPNGTSCLPSLSGLCYSNATCQGGECVLSGFDDNLCVPNATDVCTLPGTCTGYGGYLDYVDFLKCGIPQGFSGAAIYGDLVAIANVALNFGDEFYGGVQVWKKTYTWKPDDWSPWQLVGFPGPQNYIYGYHALKFVTTTDGNVFLIAIDNTDPDDPFSGWTGHIYFLNQTTLKLSTYQTIQNTYDYLDCSCTSQTAYYNNIFYLSTSCTQTFSGFAVKILPTIDYFPGNQTWIAVTQPIINASGRANGYPGTGVCTFENTAFITPTELSVVVNFAQTTMGEYKKVCYRYPYDGTWDTCPLLYDEDFVSLPQYWPQGTAGIILDSYGAMCTNHDTNETVVFTRNPSAANSDPDWSAVIYKIDGNYFILQNIALPSYVNYPVGSNTSSCIDSPTCNSVIYSCDFGPNFILVYHGQNSTTEYLTIYRRGSDNLFQYEQTIEVIQRNGYQYSYHNVYQPARLTCDENYAYLTAAHPSAGYTPQLTPGDLSDGGILVICINPDGCFNGCEYEYVDYPTVQINCTYTELCGDNTTFSTCGPDKGICGEPWNNASYTGIDDTCNVTITDPYCHLPQCTCWGCQAVYLVDASPCYPYGFSCINATCEGGVCTTHGATGECDALDTECYDYTCDTTNSTGTADPTTGCYLTIGSCTTAATCALSTMCDNGTCVVTSVDGAVCPAFDISEGYTSCEYSICSPFAMGADPTTGCLRQFNDTFCELDIAGSYTCRQELCSPDTMGANMTTGCYVFFNDAICDVDGLPCTDDVCDPDNIAADLVTGCYQTNYTEYTPCPVDIDGYECSVDQCDDMFGCFSTPHDELCDDSDPCTTDLCVAGPTAQNATAGCNNTAIIGSGSACTIDADCNDNMTCTEDYCCGSFCYYVANNGDLNTMCQVLKWTSPGETLDCPDCSPCNNDTICNDFENSLNCPGDCDNCVNDGVCAPDEGEDCADCADMHCIPNGVCEEDENRHNCEDDCEDCDSDGVCDIGENSSCSDCTTPCATPSDGRCDPEENAAVCDPELNCDCNPAVCNGDGICDFDEDESCVDCKSTPCTPNTRCEVDENYHNCAGDCDMCATDGMCAQGENASCIDCNTCV